MVAIYAMLAQIAEPVTPDTVIEPGAILTGRGNWFVSKEVTSEMIRGLKPNLGLSSDESFRIFRSLERLDVIRVFHEENLVLPIALKDLETADLR